MSPIATALKSDTDRGEYIAAIWTYLTAVDRLGCSVVAVVILIYIDGGQYKYKQI